MKNLSIICFISAIIAIIASFILGLDLIFLIVFLLLSIISGIAEIIIERRQRLPKRPLTIIGLIITSVLFLSMALANISLCPEYINVMPGVKMKTNNAGQYFYEGILKNICYTSIRVK